MRFHHKLQLPDWEFIEWVTVTIIALLLFGLAAAMYREVRSWRLKDGFITDRLHEREWTEIQYSYNPDGTIASAIPITHPERWMVEMQGAVGNEHIVRRVVVDESTYEVIQPGQRFHAD